MAGNPMIFECDYEFARIIVWDALVDPVLVSGWLGEAVIEPRVGGEYNVTWQHLTARPTSFGRISVMHDLERLDVDTSNAGRWTFELFELPGGERGTSTRLRVTVDSDVERAFESRMRADWLTNLDQLEDVLRGHPVDWVNWERDSHQRWASHLEDAQNSTA